MLSSKRATQRQDDTSNSPAEPQLIAAVDLGSNSFHTVIGRYEDKKLDIIDRHKETVRLAAGLDANDNLSEEAQQRALDCLTRLKQLLGQIPNSNIRAVGTNTLRRINQSEAFLAKAEAALGSRIDIISGHEEARLIWLGVTQSLGEAPAKRLIIDIGGGSTEFIYGENHQPIQLDSLQIGCVRLTETWFPEGKLSNKAFKEAQLDAMHELAPIQRKWRKFKWDLVIGTSGSAQAISLVLAANGISDGTITLKGMLAAQALCVACKNSAKLQLNGLSEDRQKVFAAGLAAMIGIFKSLKIKRMRTTETALREGVLFDMLSDRQGRELRHESIRALAKRYRLDSKQGRRVSKTARELLSQVSKQWGLEEDIHAAFLHWAARVHELGLSLNHRGYHRHGAYILDHSNLPGFSRQEQYMLSTLVHGHRKSLPLSRLQSLAEPQAVIALKLAVLLRIAVYLHRDRTPKKAPEVRARASSNKLTLTFRTGWLNRHPLTKLDLQTESTRLAEAGYKLSII